MLQFEALEALQTLDTQIDRLKRERARLDDASGLKREMEARRAAHTDAESKLRELKTRLTDAELQLAGIEQKKKDFERRLYEGKVTNPKELQAIEKEIEMLGRQRGRLDETILTLMEEIETATAVLARARDARGKAEAAWTEADAHFRAEVTRLDAALADLLPRRKSAAEGIEAATLRRYDDLRARAAGLAVTHVEGTTCGGCHTSLPSMIVRRAQDRAATAYSFCENCNRFLLPG
jgi:predicted  nucleic acid-binding Zn-ribbon protein